MCAVKQSPATAEKKEMTPGPASQKFFTSGPGPKDAGSCRSRLRIRGHICRRLLPVTWRTGALFDAQFLNVNMSS